MEDDVDIYADLSFDLTPEKKDYDCNCKELKEEISSLISKNENLQKHNANLEKNLSSLLITARAEITRKNNTIDDLRKKLHDVTFRRSHKYKSRDFSIHRLPYQHNVIKKYEDTSSTHLQESETEETESYQIQFCHDEYKSKKPQNEVHRMPTVFGERLYKRIIEDKKEEEKQTELIKLAADIKTKDISKENIIENDKKAGSPFSMNNNDNDSNIGRCSSSEPSYRKNLMKRTNEEDNTSRHKRIKIEKNEEETVIEETNYNHLTQYDLTDNFTQYDIKDNLKFENRLDVAHPFKKEEVSFCDERRAASEYRDTNENRSCTNGWRSETRSKSAKDHDSSYIRNSHAHSLRNFQTTSTSHTTHVSERFNSGYRKNGHRYSPPRRRSYSRSRSDYESSSNHRLREKSSRTYRETKYDNYKYDSRYKYDRLKRNYGNEENDKRIRYRRDKYDDLRDKYRYSSSDAEDKESSSSYKNKKHENRRTRKEKASILNDKKLHENDKAETNLRESSSRTIVSSTMNFSADKNVEQHKVKNESEIELKDLSEVIPIHIVKKDLENVPEEGEILDSPKKKNNFTKISTENRREEDNVKIVPVEDKNEDISVNASIDNKLILLQNDANGTKQLEVADISTKKIEVTSRLIQENSKDCEEIIQLNFCKNDVVADKINNCIKDKDKCKSFNKDLMESTVPNIGITEQVRDSDIDSSDKNDTNKKSKDSITEMIKIKEIIAFNIDSVTKIKEIDDSSIEDASKKKDISNLNIGSVVEITEINNFNNNDSIHKIGDELRISTSEVTKVEAMLNCDIEDRDKSQTSLERETLHQMSNKSAIETCLNDHNYVQNSSINVSNLDTIQNPSLKSECCTAILDTATSKEMKAEETINVQSVGVKKTISIVKNKKDQQSRGILISHRRKAVMLSDSNASMTVLMNTVKTSSVNSCNNNDSTLKPRACKISRMTTKTTCK
ncbi:PREDICTED: protein PFF0380w [Trachymyrmex septentrionalis]|uniref:protein PFF0380w n=1 Tax=Trachymyrmex septentrionalis TaxID=34720 RepID=UPI00084F196B|nr:PREDICTED: protein PFF0380w [Trachymyrmex septentrionalis]